jgi:hypothetical protein
MIIFRKIHARDTSLLHCNLADQVFMYLIWAPATSSAAASTSPNSPHASATLRASGVLVSAVSLCRLSAYLGNKTEANLKIIVGMSW